MSNMSHHYGLRSGSIKPETTQQQQGPKRRKPTQSTQQTTQQTTQEHQAVERVLLITNVAELGVPETNVLPASNIPACIQAGIDKGQRDFVIRGGCPCDDMDTHPPDNVWDAVWQTLLDAPPIRVDGKTRYEFVGHVSILA